MTTSASVWSATATDTAGAPAPSLHPLRQGGCKTVGIRREIPPVRAARALTYKIGLKNSLPLSPGTGADDAEAYVRIVDGGILAGTGGTGAVK